MNAGENEPEIRQRYLVRGTVQGVGFRWFATAAARARGLVGWVRNEPDGNVLCEAQGPQDELAGFAEDLREGPRFAHVTDIRTEEVPVAAQREPEFEVER